MILISELGIGVLGQFLHMTTCRNASDIKYIDQSMYRKDGWLYWWQGIVLFHNKGNLLLHFTVVYPVTLFVLQSLSFLGWFLIIPLQF